MKQRVSQKDGKSKGQKAVTVEEQFTGRNLTRFGGAGLIKRFFKRHRIEQMLDKKIKVEGRRTRKYSLSALLVGCLYGMFLGYSRPYHMKILRADKVFQKIVGLCGFPVQSTISRFLSSVKVSVA
ncbi:MAG: transposase, partial [Deltaproteobacteria bacterium]|nr:transposase [Deltaproteobacteria bacterium]